MDACPDVVVRQTSLALPLPSREIDGFRVHASQTCAYYTSQTIGSFLIRDGREILVDLVPDLDPLIASDFIVSRGIAVALQQRGRLVLHGSAVNVGGRAVAFLGHSGSGKSTSAGALHALGHPLVTDDIVAVESSESGAIVWPGYPLFKLWPDAMRAVAEDSDLDTALDSPNGKKEKSAARDFSLDALPLSRVYILTDGDAITIEPLYGQEALTALMRYSFVRSPLFDLAAAAEHLAQCTSVVKRVSLYRLTRPRSLTLLPALAQAVISDIKADC